MIGRDRVRVLGVGTVISLIECDDFLQHQQLLYRDGDSGAAVEW
jgi:hypothetical protein